jgi:hypothetical protein
MLKFIGGFLFLAWAIDRLWTWRRPISARLYRPFTRLGWTLTPGVRKQIRVVHQGKMIWENDIRINKNGFYDREWGPKPSGVKRILVMGDSIIESRQVPRESNFVARAEARLNAAGGRRYELFNIGVAGWSVDSVLNYFQHQGRALQPDAVILGIFVGNDLVEGDYESFRYLFNYAWDCRRYDKPAFSLQNNALVRSNYPAWRNASARFFSEELYRRSRSFRWLYQQVNRWMSKRLNGSDLLRKKGVSYNMYMEQGKGNEFYYAQTVAQVTALAEECRTVGAHFSVMLVPNFPLFYPLAEKDPQARISQEYQRDLGHYAEMKRRLSPLYPVLSLMEPLQAAGETITFKPADPHFNPAGHALVSNLLADFILRQGTESLKMTAGYTG